MDDPETLDGITITNIDIFDHQEPQIDYQGYIALNPRNSNLIRIPIWRTSELKTSEKGS